MTTNKEVLIYPTPDVAMVGGPCSGKSSILDALTDAQLKAWRPSCDRGGLLVFDEQGYSPDFLQIDVSHESWDLVGSFALLILKILEHPDTDWSDFQAGMAEEVVWKNGGKFDHEEDITLMDIYNLFEMTFLDVLTQPTSRSNPRQLVQEQLMRVTINEEKKRSWPVNPGHRQVLLRDGGLIYPPLYWDETEIPFSFYRKIFHELGYQGINVPQDILRLYDGIICLETLANLPEPEYLQYFNNGERLDAPNHAREIHARLMPLVEAHPNHLILPATMTLQEKTVETIRFLRKISDPTPRKTVSE